MSRLAADCFAAAGRLQYTSFQTNSVDLNDALLVSIHGWKDAGSRELYIYDQVHMNGPSEMGRHFWGHLPLSWMHEPMLDFTLYYILFSNEEAGDDDTNSTTHSFVSCHICSIMVPTFAWKQLVGAGWLAYRVAHECNWRKLICSTVRLERLFVTNMQNQHVRLERLFVTNMPTVVCL